jgi:hypothetical protein
MAQSAAASIVYGQNFGKAMRQALASEMETIADRAFIHAIEDAAWGIENLAMGNDAAAALYFEAAAEWGALGGAAAVAGRAVAGSAGRGGAGAGGAGGSAGRGSNPVSHPGTPSDWANQPSPGAQSSGGQHVTVNVMGHVFGISGVQQLASALNDAVLNQDVTLTATNTKTGVQVTR